MKSIDNNRSTKFLLVNPDGEYKKIEVNKGAEAVIITTVDILKKYFTNAEFTTTMQLSEKLSNKTNCKIIKNRMFTSRTYSLLTITKSSLDVLRVALYILTLKKLHILINNKKLNEYVKSDIVVHPGMDLYSDDFGTITVLEHTKDILIAILLNKPIIIWAESIGPFRKFSTKYIAKFALNRVSLITVRENIAKQYLEELGINKVPIYVTADPAFLLEPKLTKNVQDILGNNGAKYVGVSLAYLAGNAKKTKTIKILSFTAKTLSLILPERILKFLLENGKASKSYSSSKLKYISMMTSLIDNIIEEHNVKILLIPHEEPKVGKEIHEEIKESSKYKENIILIPYNLDSQEIKSLIDNCEIFIGGKMHANIAALSQNIPTLGISYSYKFQGIMGLLGQERYVSNNVTYEDINSKFNLLWNEKNNIKNELSIKTLQIKNKSNLNGKLVEEYCINNNIHK